MKRIIPAMIGLSCVASFTTLIDAGGGGSKGAGGVGECVGAKLPDLATVIPQQLQVVNPNAKEGKREVLRFSNGIATPNPTTEAIMQAMHPTRPHPLVSLPRNQGTACAHHASASHQIPKRAATLRQSRLRGLWLVIRTAGSGGGR